MKDCLRHRPFITTIFVVAIAGSPAHNPAFAQTQTGNPTPPPPRTEPSASLAEGDRLRDSGDLPGALRIFRAVQTKQPSLEGQHRIAETEDKLGQHGTAYVEYALLLDRYGTTLEPAKKRAIESRLRELDALTGMLSLEPLMPNAVVRIDGRKVDDSLLSRPIRVTRGERRIAVEQPGYRPVTLTQSVGATMAKVTLPLDPLPVTATLNVSSLSSAEVDLYLDGKKVGPLPQHLQLSMGEHVLHADGPKVYAEPRKVQLTVAASHQDLTLNLLEKPATLSIDPVAPDTVLYVDAKPLGTGFRNVELPPGKHSLELRRPGFRTQKLVLDVQAGQRNSLRAAPYVAESTSVNPVTPPPQPLTVEKPPPAEKSAKPTEQEQPALPRKPEAEEEESRFSGFYGALIVLRSCSEATRHTVIRITVPQTPTAELARLRRLVVVAWDCAWATSTSGLGSSYLRPEPSMCRPPNSSSLPSTRFPKTCKLSQAKTSSSALAVSWVAGYAFLHQSKAFASPSEPTTYTSHARCSLFPIASWAPLLVIPFQVTSSTAVFSWAALLALDSTWALFCSSRTPTTWS